MNIKVVKNAGWIISCKLIKAILTILITIFTARYLGPSNYGLISYAASLVTFITPIMKLGLDSTLVYEIVNDEKNEGEIIGTSMIMCFLSGLLCLIGILAFVLFVNANEFDTFIVTLLYGMLLLFQAIEMIQYWFQAKLLSKYSSIAMLISYIIVTIFQVYLLINQKSVYWFALSHSIDYLLIDIMLCFIYYKKSKYKLSFSLETGKKIFNNSKYYIISSLMVAVFAQTDKIMIKLMIGNEYVGYYSAATTCATMFAFVFAAIIDSTRPIIFENKNKSQELYEKSMIKIYSIIIYFSLIVSLFTTIIAPLIIRIMYGTNYYPSIISLRIIVWFSTFSYLGTIRNIWIMAEKKQKFLWIINLSGALLNIVINLILIPMYGINGAAFASLLTQIFSNFVIGFIIKPISYNNILMIKSINPKIIISILKKFLNSQKEY
ncbi:MAG: flippase [bacterium]|nr:flippase [bacterium]